MNVQNTVSNQRQVYTKSDVLHKRLKLEVIKCFNQVLPETAIFD